MTRIVAKLNKVLSIQYKTWNIDNLNICLENNNLKMNSVNFRACSNGTYKENRLRNPSLILWNLFLSEPVFKICCLNLFSTELTFRYRKLLIFRDLDGSKEKEKRKVTVSLEMKLLKYLEILNSVVS